MFGVDFVKVVVEVLGVLCLKVGKELGIINELVWVLLWVVDFLMFESDDEGNVVVMYYLFIFFLNFFFE